MEYVVGAGLALATGAFASLSGFDRDRAFCPAVLVVIALYYDLFAVMGGGDALGVEAAITAAFAAASVIGFRTNLWIVAAALVAHGLFDLLHGSFLHNKGVPAWWPTFCMTFDIVAGAWLGCLLATSRLHARGEPGYGVRIRPHVEDELLAARKAEAAGDSAAGFRHLERAHVLGQASTVEHVRVHARMLGWGLRQRQPREVAGQILRIVGAATKTSLGLIPEGNTGGANIAPFTPLPIPDDLAKTIASARTTVGAMLSVVLIVAMHLGTVAAASPQSKTDAPHIAYQVLGSGKPVIVMLSGLGADMTTFAQVAPEIATSATVIVYDRAGYGDSDPAAGPKDATNAERELSSLLARTGIPGPYVLAGHSLGGLFAEYYAAKHPEQVAGLILEESRPADFARRCEAAGLSFCTPLPAMMKNAPQGAQDEVLALPATESQVRDAGPVSGKPVLILSRPASADATTFAGQWSATQVELAKRYPGSIHLLAEGGGHDIHRDQRVWYIESVQAFLRGLS